MRWQEGVTARVIVAGLALAAGCSAAVVTTSAAVRQFLGGASGKLVYTKLDCNDQSCNKQGHSLWYVDFSEATLTERQIIRMTDAAWGYDNGEPRNTVISSDGQWVVFNVLETGNTWNGSHLYACRLQQNVTSRVDLGTGALPRLWQRPGTSELYLIYNNKDLEESGGWAMSFPWYSVTTSMRQLNPSTMQPIAAGQQLLNCMANGNRSKSGAWMFAAGGVPGTFRIDPTVVSNAAIHETIGLSENDNDMTDPLDGCNPSMSPHESDADLRVMYVCRGEDQDVEYDHRAYWLCDVRGNNRQRIMWNCPENPYIDEPEWCPTHPDYGAAKASAGYLEAPFDLYLYKIWTGENIKILEGNYSFPYLWVDQSSIGVREPRPSGALAESWSVTAGAGRVAASCGATVTRVSDVRGRSTGTQGVAPGAYMVQVRGAQGRTMVQRVVMP